jgi:hypothetical protein
MTSIKSQENLRNLKVGDIIFLRIMKIGGEDILTTLQRTTIFLIQGNWEKGLTVQILFAGYYWRNNREPFFFKFENLLGLAEDIWK